ncbi:FecR family protein [Chitinophaga rhizophila]|uniref:FecR family protein n=1 Tax=Chitinophaga rhizophila TaxID=2866212 RepID=A0ABS7GGH7_9BACT|nr:FecR family protein [Chitinophaga rhizophila]MBW8686794.1 FecR family protein [Chitinophaga rhizophila]
MENMPLELEALIIAEIADTITPEEQVLLNKLREVDPAVNMLSAELYKSLGSIRRETKEEMHTSARKIISMANAIDRSKRSSLYVRIRVPLIAACLLAMIILGITAYNNYTNKIPALAQKDNNATYLFDGESWITLQNETLRLSNNGEIYADDKLLNVPRGMFTRHQLEIQTGFKKICRITLPDGSGIVANAGSRITFPKKFTGKQRDIFIDGEAYCDIASEPGRPFIVQHPTGKVEVLGTAFNINTFTKGSPSVAVVSGSVRMNDNGINTQLGAGDKGIYKQGHYLVQKFDQKEVTSWKENVLFFVNASKSDVENAFESFYGKQLSIDRDFPNGMGRLNIVRTEDEKDFINQLPHRMELNIIKGVYHLK